MGKKFLSGYFRSVVGPVSHLVGQKVAQCIISQRDMILIIAVQPFYKMVTIGKSYFKRLQFLVGGIHNIWYGF